ncbi:MAG: hypothetical protein AB7S92_17570 [Parvibaculaceae bacterium]
MNVKIYLALHKNIRVQNFSTLQNSKPAWAKFRLKPAIGWLGLKAESTGFPKFGSDSVAK